MRARCAKSRRGGNRLDLPPHEADIAEDIDTARGAATVTWFHTPTARTDYRLTLSAADTRRDSYYGVGQDPLAYGDTRSRLGVADLLVNRYTSRHVDQRRPAGHRRAPAGPTARLRPCARPALRAGRRLRAGRVDAAARLAAADRRAGRSPFGADAPAGAAARRAARVAAPGAGSARELRAGHPRATGLRRGPPHRVGRRRGARRRGRPRSPAGAIGELDGRRRVEARALGWTGPARGERVPHAAARPVPPAGRRRAGHRRERVPEGEPRHGDRARRRGQRRLGPRRPPRAAGRIRRAAQHVRPARSRFRQHALLPDARRVRQRLDRGEGGLARGPLCWSPDHRTDARPAFRRRHPRGSARAHAVVRAGRRVDRRAASSRVRCR